MIEDEMVGWHHQLNGHEFEQALGDSEGRESLVCCSPCGCKESDTTQQLKTTVSGNYVLNECQLSLVSSLLLTMQIMVTAFESIISSLIWKEQTSKSSRTLCLNYHPKYSKNLRERLPYYKLIQFKMKILFFFPKTYLINNSIEITQA